MNLINRWWGKLIRFGFRLLYYEMAWSYDLVSWLVSLGEWRRWQLSSLTFLPNQPSSTKKTLLELGHGPGHMISEVVKRGYRAVGIDLSPFMGRLAQARIDQEGLGNAAAVVRTAIPALPFQSQSFDCVLSQFPTPYILEPATAAAIFRVLKPGGRLIVLPEGHLTGRSILHRAIAWLFWITGQSVATTNTARTIDEVWQPWKNHFQTAGFAVEINTVNHPRSVCTVMIAKKPEKATSNY
ncbi:MAG: class I SAM-dependent methyltransferase [Ardenticatenaceae bacterium]|nr:class I SAM-dependent methyltransferase [Ardenticatenaceae bacterium]